MADNDLKVIVKAKELARHSFVLTSYNAWLNHISHGNCYKLSQKFNQKIQIILAKDK